MRIGLAVISIAAISTVIWAIPTLRRNDNDNLRERLIGEWISTGKYSFEPGTVVDKDAVYIAPRSFVYDGDSVSRSVTNWHRRDMSIPPSEIKRLKARILDDRLEIAGDNGNWTYLATVDRKEGRFVYELDGYRWQFDRGPIPEWFKKLEPPGW
jgi:hypothetical protein